MYTWPNERLESEVNTKDLLLKKVVVCAYVQNTKIEMYKSIFSTFPQNAPLRDLNSEPPDLDTETVNLQVQTVRRTFFLHYNRWMNILYYSRDTRMPAIQYSVVSFLIRKTSSAFTIVC
mgnify:CR=1 FL=1